ncbi:transposase [Methylopila sp. 73B]|uniref:transposase n=1 Tax=Methylopila sp. 73B TaxID=1120792 RepID=UPI00037286BF|nr:transposase [Methylopila sp. 73B]
MSRSRLTDEEIAGLLQEVENGAPLEAVCESAHVSVRTFYRWKQKFAGLAPAGVRQLRALSLENQELRRLLAQKSAIIGGPRDADLRTRGPAAPGARQANLGAREMHGLGLGRFATVRVSAIGSAKTAR